MKWLFVSVAAMIASAMVILLAAGFWLSGGFEKIFADRAVANRGYVASEPLVAPGFRALKAPKGWEFDRRNLYLRLAPPEGPLALTEEGDARTFLTLGLYYHAGGAELRGSIEIAARASSAPPWTPPDFEPIHYPDGEIMQLGWVEQAGMVAPPLQLFRVSRLPPSPEPPAAGAFNLALHDPSRGVRVELRTSADVYTFEQAVALAQSVLESVEPDWAAINAAPRKTR